MARITAQLETWQVKALELLAQAPSCGYRAHSAPRVEPTSLAAMALQSYQRESARQASGWLAEKQLADGRVSDDLEADPPGWGTGLAILAWKSTDENEWSGNIERGVRYLLSVQGKVMDDPDRLVEHDTTIPGWPWIGETHSWLEPTAMAVAALESAGYGDHPRTIDGRRILLDRILANGGCNYGNTIVLKQQLRPLAQPTGIAMLALARRESNNPRLTSTLDYLEKYLSGPVTTLSASYASIGLCAHGRSCVDAKRKIRSAAEETLRRHAGPGHLALALLAAAGRESALVRTCLESEV